MKQFYTTAEAAQELGLQPKSVTRHIIRGNITAEKVGRDYLISAKELARFQHERRSKGRPAASERHC